MFTESISRCLISSLLVLSPRFKIQKAEWPTNVRATLDAHTASLRCRVVATWPQRVGRLTPFNREHTQLSSLQPIQPSVMVCDWPLININIKHVQYISIRDWTIESSSWVCYTNPQIHTYLQYLCWSVYLLCECSSLLYQHWSIYQWGTVKVVFSVK